MYILHVDTHGYSLMAMTKLFKAGNSQAVRIPKEFRMKGTDVEIFRRKDELILREPKKGLGDVIDLFRQLPDDMFPEGREDPPPQKRKRI